MHGRPILASECQPASRTSNRILREVFWFVGCVVVVGVFVVIVMSTVNGPTASESIDEFAIAVAVLSVFGLVTAVRVAWWLIKGDGRRY